jgi:hypothetical protein
MKYIKNFNALNEIMTYYDKKTAFHLYKKDEELDFSNFFKQLNKEERENVYTLFGENLKFYVEELEVYIDNYEFDENDDFNFKEFIIILSSWLTAEFGIDGAGRQDLDDFKIEDVQVSFTNTSFDFLSEEEQKEKKDLIEKFRTYIETYYWDRLEDKVENYRWVEEYGNELF